MTTQPELPEAVAPLAPVVRLAAVPDTGRPDVDFESFVRRYEGRLRRLVLRRIGDQSEAEEITQETMLRAYQHRASFATEDELMAWSTVVAQRLVIDRVRVRGRSVAVADVPEGARLGRDTAEIVVARHEARAALEALEAIPTRQAAILWAREVEGLHYEDIALRFDITEPAVRSLLHRGRKALRKEFKDRTGTLPLNGLVPFAPWLLALRAAGQVRKAAKTAASKSASGVAALTFIGVTALTMSPWTGAPGGVVPPRDTRPWATTAVQVSSTRSDAAAHDSLGIATRDVAAGHSGGSGNTARHVLPPVCASRCPTVTQENKPYTVTLWVGPELPDNPAGIRRVGLGEYGIVDDCADVPDVPMTQCTSNHPEEGEHEEQPAEPVVSPESVAGAR